MAEYDVHFKWVAMGSIRVTADDLDDAHGKADQEIDYFGDLLEEEVPEAEFFSREEVKDPITILYIEPADGEPRRHFRISKKG